MFERSFDDKNYSEGLEQQLGDQTFLIIYTTTVWESNQGNQDSSGNQKNATQGQRPDMENKHNKEQKVTKIIHTK